MIAKIARRLIFNVTPKAPFAQAASNKDVPATSQGQKFQEMYKDPTLDKHAYLEYKKHPSATLSHYNPKSKDYVQSERDDYNADTVTNSYNYYVTRFKEDLKIQKQVNEILRKMDRPYLRGAPGQYRNISGGVQEYSAGDVNGRHESPDDNVNNFLGQAYANEKRFINQSIFTPKFAKMKHYDEDWPKELASRPINKHFHPDKGYKYDVEVPYEQRYQYFADRIGHPEILGNPLERFLRLESELYHPQFLDQPFVHIPDASPHKSLNFEEGEVVYENTNLLEWAKFWNYGVIAGYVWCALFVPYNLLFKTHMPMEHALDNIFWPWYQRSMFFWDNNALHIPVVGLVALYSSYIALSYLHNGWKDYVVRMQYSKDKELLFVTRVSPFASTMEEVYETAHLELLPPSVKSGLAHMSAMDDDGLLDVTCMNSQRSLVFYNESKYWNPKLKQDFIDRVNHLWTKDYAGYNRQEWSEFITNNQISLFESDKPKLQQK